MGKLYVISILLVSGPTGLYLAFFAEGGSFATLGFILMALIWMGCTYMAFHTIVNGEVVRHKNWMIRSYCMTMSGVTLRIFTPIGSEYLDYETNFIVSAYLPWVINLIIGEILVFINKSKINLVNI